MTTFNNKNKFVQVWRRRWFTSNVHGSPFLFFDLRGDATGKLAGIGKNVNDESCSNRRALQIDHELRNPKRSSPFLFFYGGNREKRK